MCFDICNTTVAVYFNIVSVTCFELEYRASTMISSEQQESP